jgi:hypothetical protein
MRKIILLGLFIIVLMGCTKPESKESENRISLQKMWKFHKGDSLIWAEPGLDDRNWKKINPSEIWERQNWDDYDGYAWYRLSFFLPEKLKQQAVISDSLLFYLGKIDDTDQTFLNSHLIGQNGATIAFENREEIGAFENEPGAYNVTRDYMLSLDDERIMWGQENTIAIRVHDHGGGGGMYFDGEDRWITEVQTIYVGVPGIEDYIYFTETQSGFNLSDKDLKFEVKDEYRISKKIIAENRARDHNFQGEFSYSVIDVQSGEKLSTGSKDLILGPGQMDSCSISLSCDLRKRHIVKYTYNEENYSKKFSFQEEVPYLLTPQPEKKPQINSPAVYGARPDRPFLYRIPVTGERPIEYACTGLPEGLSLNSETGIIKGKVENAGNYTVKLSAKNGIGKDEKEMVLKIGDTIALTPPLGWNSWNCWGCSVTPDKVKAAADGMINSGLVNYGWTYINIDDCWQSNMRDPETERIYPNDKFLDMPGLADYVHYRGLKIGLYTCAGDKTCQGLEGSEGYERTDIMTYADLGYDYVKVDWCYNHGMDAKTRYKLFGEAIADAHRDIVFSICNWGYDEPWEWGAEVGGNLWRTTGDIVDTWKSMSTIGFSQDTLWKYAKPGHWNDPDMLVVGKVGWGPQLHRSRLSPSEQYTHITLWSLLSAPLLIGCDMSEMNDFTLNLLCNSEVLAVNQDRLGKQARSYVKKDAYQVWAKELSDGSRAVGIFNMQQEAAEISFNFKELNLSSKQHIRDLWRQEDLGAFDQKYESKIPAHGAQLLKMTKIE